MYAASGQGQGWFFLPRVENVERLDAASGILERKPKIRIKKIGRDYIGKSLQRESVMAFLFSVTAA